MKRITLTFMILLSVFFTIWGVKMKHPINRPENVKEDTETPWYETKYQAPKADDEWTLDPEIPLNYIPVPEEDELYMVVDDSGNITNYRKRVKQADGSWVWQDVNPDIPDNYEKVDGLDNVYKVTNKDGTTEYKQYVRNDDDTYCFVPVDEKGNPLDLKNDASTISKNYVHADGNIYALYNKDSVKMGYRERVKNNDGSYSWKVADPPKTSKIAGNGSGLVTKKNQNTSSGSSNNSSSSDANKTLIGDSGNSSTKKTNSDGTYTITEKTVDTKTENGYTITYQTTVNSTYSKDGVLLSTKKDGPYEVSRVAATGETAKADQSKIASTLDGELSRVSAKVAFDTNKANEVLAKLNAERKNQGLNTLSMSASSEAYKIACIRAADMAIYDHSSSSPMYGDLNALVSRYHCTTSHASENIWKASTKTAAQIHTRFQANTGSRKVRMSSGYTEVGIAIVEKNNQTYVAEIYLK